MEHITLIEKLGGSRAIADTLGLKINRVSNWSSRGIPWPYRWKIAEMAKKKRIAVPDNFLIGGDAETELV